ncbi:glycosyltransferase family protein [Methanosarcina mazei]
MSIGSTVLLARRYAGRVIVIDDGSSDSTAEVAAIAGADPDRILSLRS